MQIIIFWLVQVSALLVFFATPFRWPLVALWAASHFVRAISLTLAYHRYYAHRAFKMSRAARFVWTLIGTSSMQKGPLWWAGHHVNHHRFADRDGDPHSPMVSGLFYAHIGWFLNDTKHDTLERSNPVVRDFSRFPEIKWLDTFHYIPPAALAAAMYAIGGLPWLVWGFCLPTMTLAHATFCINTVNHLFGSRRFETLDESRNNALTAFFAVGEGWHNNHHRYQRAARNGFYWWEFDPTWYVIRAMQTLGLAWDVQRVPARIYEEARAAKARRAASRMPSIIDAPAMPLELAEESE
ncbi:MAG TPA: acyl-CoA desaturase [Vicinamibacterales bacterium]|nr:acyl-CoA desaturase [Vicinamibacterales bacterium]